MLLPAASRCGSGLTPRRASGGCRQQRADPAGGARPRVDDRRRVPTFRSAHGARTSECHAARQAARTGCAGSTVRIAAGSDHAVGSRVSRSTSRRRRGGQSAADRSRRTAGGDARRCERRPEGARQLRRRSARALRRSAQRAGRRHHQPALSVPPLRTSLRAPGVRPRGATRGLVEAKDRRQTCDGSARGMVEHASVDRALPRSADRLAGARLQHVREAPGRLRSLRVAPDMGARHAARPSARSAAAPLRSRHPRARRHRRPAMERRAGTAPSGGLVSQLHAHALGQKDSRVVTDAAGRARTDDPHHEPMVAGRP